MSIAGVSLEEYSKNDPIPYALLLLADESITAINNYIHHCKIFQIKESSHTIGVCAIQQKDTSTIEIKNLAIVERYRNRGIGQWCMQKIGELYQDKDQLVATGDHSTSALRFYERNGFKRHFIRKDFYIVNYDQPIIENGMQLRDQIVLRKAALRP